MRIDEQIVLVTGGARGLGAAITRAFAREGARVVVNWYRSEDAAARLVAEIGTDRVVAVQGDVTDAESVSALVAAGQERFGGAVTTVVNNALPEFSFNGDAREKADSIGWNAFEAQLRGKIGRASCRERV